MSEDTEVTNVPPYIGVPRLSHQCPVDDVVAVVVITADEVVDVVTEVAGVDVVVEVVLVDVCVGDVVVDVLQDAKTSEITMVQVSSTQITPLFMQASFLICILPDDLTINLSEEHA